MAKLSDLLRYKEKVEILHPTTQKRLATVWVKLMGDEDLQDALRAARIASSEKRAALKDKETPDYKDVVVQLEHQDREVWEQLILSSEENKFVSQATVVVDREELPDMESIAVTPDAPTLEEQERLDDEIDKVNKAHREALEKYVDERLDVVRAEIKEQPDKEIFQKAILAMEQIQPLQEFVNELSRQRGYRGTWDDEACKKRSFESPEDFNNSAAHIKEVILSAYEKLEIGPDDLKN